MCVPVFLGNRHTTISLITDADYPDVEETKFEWPGNSGHQEKYPKEWLKDWGDGRGEWEGSSCIGKSLVRMKRGVLLEGVYFYTGTVGAEIWLHRDVFNHIQKRPGAIIPSFLSTQNAFQCSFFSLHSIQEHSDICHVRTIPMPVLFVVTK